MQQPNHRIAAIKIYVLDAAYNCFKKAQGTSGCAPTQRRPVVGVRSEVRRYADGAFAVSTMRASPLPFA